MSVINKVAHGLVAGQRVAFSSLAGGAPIDPDIVYFIVPTVTADTFQISEQQDGTPLTFATITSANMQVVPEVTDGSDLSTPAYTAISDPTVAMAPPTVPPTPPVPTVSSGLTSGVLRLAITLNSTAEAKVRVWEAQTTHKFTTEQAIAGGVTGVAATDIITIANHGLVLDDKVRFKALNGGAGLTVNAPDYFVIATNLTTNTFMVSLSLGGAAVDFTSDIIATSTAVKVIAAIADWTSPITYTLPQGATQVSSPCLPSTAYAVRLRAIDVYGTASAYCAEVSHTTAAGNDSLSAALASMANDVQDGIITETKIAPNSISTPLLKAGAVTAQILAATIVLSSLIQTPSTTTLSGPLTGVASTDLLTSAAHGLVANNRVRFLALTGGAGLTANAPDYFVIASGLTANDFKVSATLGGGAVNFTTDITAPSTVAKVIRRVEIDTDGVRLLDTDDSIIVNIPTNGPVYFRGSVDADTLTVQTSTTLRTAVSLESSAVMTLQNGVAAPSSTPSLVASVDALTLASSPTNPAPGIGYDSAAGTFWTASDPTVSPYYVAQEWNATTGTLVRSIPATGSISTYTATAGATSHVSDTAEGIVGSTDSHITTPVVCPTIGGASNYQMTKVAVWMAGRNGTCSTRTGAWSTGNVSLRESTTFTAASGGPTTLGASDLHNQTLSSPLAITPGTTYRIGFRRTNTSDGSQMDRDDGSSKTTYSGDGTTFDGTGWGTHNSASKPNAYFTYTYDVDSRKETAKMIAVCTDGTHIYTLDTLGQVWKYLRSDMSWVANSGVQTAITGTKTQAGMFYDATATELIITTTSGTGAGVYPKAVRVTPSTLAISATVYTAATGPTFSGTTDTFRGGARLADPLNASAATYWIATTAAVYGYTFSGTTLTNTANRDFGLAATVGSGLTHDGTVFRGWATGTPTKVHKFSAWDWTTASSVYWIGYAWYDSNATGGTHETACGPRASITMRRRERVQVGNPAIPVGGTDDPDKVRVYTLPGAADFTATTAWLQITDALTSRYMTDYTGSGTHDGAGTAFPAGTPAQLKDAGGKWVLKGSGFVNRVGTSFPASPVTNDTFWRSDLSLEFFYDGTRWLSTQLITTGFPMRDTNTFPFTANGTMYGSAPAPITTNAWLVGISITDQVITTNNGTNFWTFSTSHGTSPTSAADGVATVAQHWVTVGQSIAVASNWVTVSMLKTLTPGSLYVAPMAYWRYIAT